MVLCYLFFIGCCFLRIIEIYEIQLHTAILQCQNYYIVQSVKFFFFLLLSCWFGPSIYLKICCYIKLMQIPQSSGLLIKHLL